MTIIPRSLVLLMFLAVNVVELLAQQEIAEPLLNILERDGSLRLESVRSGSFDPRGLRLRLASDGSPRFVSDTSGWDDRFGSARETMQIYAVKVKGDDVYLGGRFELIDTTRARNVIRWNRTTRRWYPLGSGIDGPVVTMLLDGDDLYVAGQFGSAGSQPAGSIARWDMTDNEWAPLGAGVGSSHLPVIASLALEHGRLYVGGSFQSAGGRPVRSLAAWDLASESWVETFGGVDGDIHAMTTGGGSLYIGGMFSQVGGTFSARNIARFDGSGWHTIGNTGAGGTVVSIAYAAGKVVIGGEFTEVDGVEANKVAQWSGTAWSPLGGGLGDAPPDLSILGSRVYAITYEGPTESRTLRVFDPASGAWSFVDAGMEGQIYDLEASGDSLIVAGNIASLDTDPVVVGVGTLSSGRLRPLVGRVTTSVDGMISVIAVHGTDVYIGGTFSMVADRRISNVARWNSIDGTWHPLGSGVDTSVYALMAVGDSIIVGGLFDSAGGVPARRVAGWDIGRGQWFPMDTGIGVRVRAFALLDNRIHAVGYDSIFGVIRPVSTPGVVSRWNGTRWERLGNATFDRAVKAVTVDGNDLYIAGDFTRVDSDTTVSYVARWNGSGWEAVGPTLPLPVAGPIDIRAVAWYRGDLYVGGLFPILFPGQITRTALVRWISREERWEQIDTAANNSVGSLLATDDGLYVGGSLDSIGSIAVSGVALVDGREVVPLGEGISDVSRSLRLPIIGAGNGGYVMALARSGRDLYAGGAFLHAGSMSSYNFAHWSEPARLVRASALPLEIEFGTVDPGDSTLRILSISNSLESNSFLRGTVDSVIGTFTVVSGAGPFTLGLGSAHEVILRFSPPAAGVYLDTLSIEHDATIGSDGGVLLIGRSGGSGVDGDLSHPDAGMLATFPNPARDRVRVSYATSRHGDLRLTIVEPLGQTVATLVDGVVESGDHEVEWDLSSMSNGVYLIVLESDGLRCTAPIVVSR